MGIALTEPPGDGPDIFLNFPYEGDLDDLKADIAYTLNHYDWDLGGHLLDGQDIRIVDCGNVTVDESDHKEHDRRAEQVARKIFAANATLITLGGDHGAPIPVMRALDVFDARRKCPGLVTLFKSVCAASVAHASVKSTMPSNTVHR